MKTGHGKAGGARVGGGGEEGLVEVDLMLYNPKSVVNDRCRRCKRRGGAVEVNQGRAADDVQHSACHAKQRLLGMM